MDVIYEATRVRRHSADGTNCSDSDRMNMNMNMKSMSTQSKSNSNRPRTSSKRRTSNRWLCLYYTAATVTTTIVTFYTVSSSSLLVDAFSVSPLSHTSTSIHNHVNFNVRTHSSAHSQSQHSSSRSSSAFVLNVSQSIETSEHENSTQPKNRIPKQITNFYDLEQKVAPKPTYTINVEAEASKSTMERKIVHLLSDDDGEEDDLIPDYSEAAANEIADKSYSRISEEAKLKANYAMQKAKQSDAASSSRISSNGRASSASGRAMSNNDMFNEEHSVIVKKKRRFTASVKETGEDTMSQYVKSMGSHELLPKESEILLGKQIQILGKWEIVRQELEEELSCPPTFAQWSNTLGVSVPELKKQIRRSQRAKAALIEANLRLVVTVARQTVKKGRSEINFQDACQEGIIGLSRACEKFDPEKGFRFSTYAIWWIKREVRKNLLEQSRSVRLPASAIKKINDIRINERLLMGTLGRKPTDEEVAQKCNITIEKVLFYRRKALDATSLDKQLVGKAGKGSSASGIDANGKTIGSLVKDLGPTPTEIANKEMFQNDIRRLIRTLSPREQAVIRLRFGLDDGTPRTLDYIGTKFNVQKDRIRKIEAKALLKLRQPYRNQSVKCYISDL